MNPQAVVCNTKVENIPLLTTLGFDLQNDIISLDPNDPKGYVWDMAADVDDYGSISDCSERLIPTPAARRQCLRRAKQFILTKLCRSPSAVAIASARHPLLRADAGAEAEGAPSLCRARAEVHAISGRRQSS